MGRRELPDAFVNQEVPLVGYDDEGKRHLLGRAVILSREGGITAIFDQLNDETDGFVAKAIKAITQGVVNSLSIIPAQATEPPIETERE